MAVWVHVLEYDIVNATSEAGRTTERKVFAKREAAIEWANTNLLMKHNKVLVSLHRELVEGATKEDFS